MLPGLQSFCVYAAAAIFAIYALQVIIITKMMIIMIMMMEMTVTCESYDDNNTGDTFCSLIQLG